jgi:hypothetical protein
LVLREMVAKLGLDFDAQSFLKAEVAFSVLQKGAQLVAAAVEHFAGALGDAIVQTARKADALDELSQKVGIGTEQLQEFGYAAGLSGLTTESMAQALGLLSRNVFAASKGSGDAAEAFQKVGVSFRASSGGLKKADDLLLDLADKFKAMPGGMEKTNLAMRLFGRSGKEMIPFLNNGRAGIAALAERAHGLGAVMDEETIASGRDLSDVMDDLHTLSQGLAKTFAVPLLKPLAQLGRGFLDWAQANRTVIKTRMEVFARLLVKGLHALVAAAKWTARWIDLLALALASLGLAIVLTHIPALWALATAYTAAGWAAVVAGVKAAFAWAAAAAPVVLLAALLLLVALAAEDVYGYLTGADSAIGELGPKWTKFLDSWLANDAGDGWLMTALKAVIWMLSDVSARVPEALGEWKAMFGRAIDWISEKVRSLADMVRTAVLPVTSVGRWLGDTARMATSGIAGAGQGMGSAIGGLLHPVDAFGGGASPAASAAIASGGGPKVVSSISAPIAIHTQPGQNAEEIAGKVRQVVNDEIGRHLQEAAAATQ